MISVAKNASLLHFGVVLGKGPRSQKEAFQMQRKPTRARRPRQRFSRAPIERHQIQEPIWPDTEGPVFRNRSVRIEIMSRQPVTADGGLALAHQIVTRVGLDRSINRHLRVLAFHLPYHESDHVLTHAYNLFVGGRYIEDIASLQHSPAIKNLLGAVRIPDPTTAGDFLRRFGIEDLRALQAAIDEARVRMWKKLPRRMRESITLDMDSTFKEVYGQCKQGADFSYNGKWSYHPLLFTLSETGECLRMINRPGNRPSAEGAAEELGPCLDQLCANFRRVYLRGDSKFAERAILLEALIHGVRFAIVQEMNRELVSIAMNLENRAWKPFRTDPTPLRGTGCERRRRRVRHRRRIARARGYAELSTAQEWVAEIPHRRRGIDQPLRLVFKRRLIEEWTQQGLFTRYEYQAVISDIPPQEMSGASVVRFAYKRCNQENAIEQAKNGLKAMQMPTGELLANGAFLLAAEIAWNLRAWLSLLALPIETCAWEWGWFRRCFVHAPAHIVSRARSAVVRLADSHRFSSYILSASQRLASLSFG